MPINLEYPGAQCPVCQEPIDDDKEAGDECDGCSYIFIADYTPDDADLLREQWINGQRKDVVETLLKAKRSALVAFVVELVEIGNANGTDEVGTLSKMLTNRND